MCNVLGSTTSTEKIKAKQSQSHFLFVWFFFYKLPLYKPNLLLTGPLTTEVRIRMYKLLRTSGGTWAEGTHCHKENTLFSYKSCNSHDYNFLMM